MISDSSESIICKEHHTQRRRCSKKTEHTIITETNLASLKFCSPAVLTSKQQTTKIQLGDEYGYNKNHLPYIWSSWQDERLGEQHELRKCSDCGKPAATGGYMQNLCNDQKLTQHEPTTGDGARCALIKSQHNTSRVEVTVRWSKVRAAKYRWRKSILCHI